MKFVNIRVCLKTHFLKFQTVKLSLITFFQSNLISNDKQSVEIAHILINLLTLILFITISISKIKIFICFKENILK